MAKKSSRPARPEKPEAQQPGAPGPAAPATPQQKSVAASVPERRSTYFEAVAVYERGLEALQRHDYTTAEKLFESVLGQFPEEKELHERVRLYVNICRRQSTMQRTAPATIDERLYAATLAVNSGNYDEALQHLRLVRDEDPDNDHALYMLAVAHAQKGEPVEAVAHLERAIALNPENRALAKNDPDLEPLRGDEAFRAAMEAPPSGRIDRRRPIRTKTAR
jgi:outer membrane protein assembly factor BamD (BamD/ComL family)